MKSETLPNNSDPEEIAMQIFLVATHLLRYERSGAPGESLRAPKLSTLQALVRRGTIDLEDLAAAERVQAPSLNETLNVLGDRGLITKERNTSGDRRRVTIRITRAGRAQLKRERRRLARLLPVLNEEQLRTLSEAVRLLQITASGGAPAAGEEA
jgi:DNA-binding MarR family transcriptional regulator